MKARVPGIRVLFASRRRLKQCAAETISREATVREPSEDYGSELPRPWATVINFQQLCSGSLLDRNIGEKLANKNQLCLGTEVTLWLSKSGLS